jgi:uncharacterized protein YifE (UPF0438 family)
MARKTWQQFGRDPKFSRLTKKSGEDQPSHGKEKKEFLAICSSQDAMAWFFGQFWQKCHD